MGLRDSCGAAASGDTRRLAVEEITAEVRLHGHGRYWRYFITLVGLIAGLLPRIAPASPTRWQHCGRGEIGGKNGEVHSIGSRYGWWERNNSIKP
jgi:hypothetical protein